MESDLDRFVELTNTGRWAEALPVIERITAWQPAVATSWFNWGVCLDELGRYAEAADKFIKAIELAPDDYGTFYRAFKSLHLAGGLDRFIQLASALSERTPEVLPLLNGRSEFRDFTSRSEFQSLLR